jgi:hypothetical protein
MSITKQIPYTIKTNGAITLYLNGECLTVATDHPNYNKILDAIKVADFSNIDNLVNVAKAVTSYGGGKIKIVNGEVFYGTFALHNTLTNRILKMMAEGFKFDHMIRFLENLLLNPSNRAVNETYAFLENYGLPITPDGCFLAYKAVRPDYKDIYSGTLDNKIGAVVSYPRNQVDEDYNRDCSTGLHVGALDYVVQYGHFTKGQAVNGDATSNKLLIVKVNPKDVVSVPKYESHPKMRVAEYTVVSEITDVVKELDKVVYDNDATVLAPDGIDCDGCEFPSDDDHGKVEKNPTNKVKIDTTSGWDENKYREGWNDADTDCYDGQPYGYSRDYTEVNSYRVGYNDRFNGRANKADSAPVAGLWPAPADNTGNPINSDDESGSGVAYDSGFELGYSDAATHEGYQTNLDIGETDAFKEGYEDGYNQAREDRAGDD